MHRLPRWWKRTVLGTFVVVGLPFYKGYQAIKPLHSDPEKSISVVSLPSFSSLSYYIPPPSSSVPSTTPSTASSTSFSLPILTSLRSLYWRLWKINEGSDRLIRDVYTVIQIVMIYVQAMQRDKRTLIKDTDTVTSSSTTTTTNGWSLVHQQAADRLLKLCQVNKGIYIKLAQHIAQLQYLVPEPYVRTLSVMTHAAPVDDWTTAKETLEYELRKKYNNPNLTVDDIFETIDPQPIASASLAQVHVGTLRSDIEQRLFGTTTPTATSTTTAASSFRKVAVKIQHPGLMETSDTDIYTIVTLVNYVKRLFPKFNYEWLGYEVQRNVPRELNFLLEAENAERTRTNFRHRQDVIIPHVYAPLCTSRLLIMSFEEGVYPNNVPVIEKEMGLQRKDVAQLISEVFAEQIFFFGYCHCDPHAANLLIRPLPSNARSSLHNSIVSYIPFFASFLPSSPKPQLVLLDHGLYRDLSPYIRYNYAKFWRAIIFADEERMEKYGKRLSIEGEYFKLFASMLTTKKWATLMEVKTDVNILRSEGTKEEIQTISNDVRAYAEQIQDLLALLPRDLLLILKTNDCLRTIDWGLGTPINNFNVVARYTQKAINHRRWDQIPEKYGKIVKEKSVGSSYTILRYKINRYRKNIREIMDLEWRLRMMNSAFSFYRWLYSWGR